MQLEPNLRQNETAQRWPAKLDFIKYCAFVQSCLPKASLWYFLKVGHTWQIPDNEKAQVAKSHKVKKLTQECVLHNFI